MSLFFRLLWPEWFLGEWLLQLLFFLQLWRRWLRWNGPGKMLLTISVAQFEVFLHYFPTSDQDLATIEHGKWNELNRCIISGSSLICTHFQVKCSECDEMAYSRPLLLRHMTQAHGIVAPLIYKTFSDREKLQVWLLWLLKLRKQTCLCLKIWLEQLRETHAIEFVVSSGSKKWGQGLQVRFCSINCHTFVTMVVFWDILRSIE